jgi:hypothetical protein
MKGIFISKINVQVTQILTVLMDGSRIVAPQCFAMIPSFGYSVICNNAQEKVNFIGFSDNVHLKIKIWYLLHLR